MRLVRTFLVFALTNAAVYVLHPRLVRKFRKKTGCFPDVAFPRTIQEKFLWRKVFDHNPLFVRLSDKLAAKGYIAAVCPELHIPEVLWRGASPADIPEVMLGCRGVLKSSHGSGQLVFLPVAPQDRSRAIADAAIWLGAAYGQRKGEWAYRDLERQIFIEELIRTPDDGYPTEYMVHVCDGKAVWVLCMRGRFGPAPVATYFNRDGAIIEEPDRSHFRVEDIAPGPLFSEAIRLAERLAARIDYARCDFYELAGMLHAGEITVYTASGFPGVKNSAILEPWAAYWNLQRSWFLSARQTGWWRIYAHCLANALKEMK
ncbi:MAG TPA: ATP-grasp fold amidoligase family protein [Rhizobiaceae bacterium]|nr:ATP-grasp fold amidoligase family protein [Rhizobiaceae bacterium]